MEELAALCEQRMPIITISQEWEEFDSAKQLLDLNAYEEKEQEQGSSSISFVRKTNDEVIPVASQLIFPSEHPKPQYTTPSKRTAPGEGGWKDCDAIQLDTDGLSPEQQLKVSALDKRQIIMCQFLIQPSIQICGTQCYLKLGIDHFQLGASAEDFLLSESAIGYYPYFVQIKLEPVFSGEQTSVPVYRPRGDPNGEVPGSGSMLIEETSTNKTDVSFELGYSPVALKLNHSWERSDKRTRGEKPLLELLPIEHKRNIAGFEWRILRWGNRKEYNVSKPESVLSFNNPKLPFGSRGRATSAKLEGFQDIWWRFNDEKRPTEIMINITAGLHLVTQTVGCWSKSLNHKAESYKYQASCLLKYPTI